MAYFFLKRNFFFSKKLSFKPQMKAFLWLRIILTNSKNGSSFSLSLINSEYSIIFLYHSLEKLNFENKFILVSKSFVLRKFIFLL